MLLGRVRLDVLGVAGVIGVAAAFRFTWLDLMEFKADEANACRLALHVLGYSEPGVGRFFPTAGLVSSVGIPNPPLFVYLMALPLAVVRSPLAAVVFVAGANVLAVWLTYVAGKRCFGRFVGMCAAALLALSPWGIVFSRKIWAQDLLPLVTSLFILELHGLLVERRARSAAGLVALTAVGIQLHFSAVILVPVTALALWLGRAHVQLRWLAGGLLVAMLLYAPYLALHAGSIAHTAAHHAPYLGPSLVDRFESAGNDILGIVGGGNMAYLIGNSSTLATTLSVLLGLVAPLGLLHARPGDSTETKQLRAVFCLWYALPLVVLTLLEIRPYMHYFIILLPLPFFGIASVAERALRRRPRIAVGAVAAVLVCFLLLDIRLVRTIVHDGGAPGDYGIAYRYKHEAAAVIVRTASGHPVRLGIDERFAPSDKLTAYRFLIWNAHPNRAQSTGPPIRSFLLIDSFAHTLFPRRAWMRPGGRKVRFGPLTLLQLRDQRSHA